MPDFSIRTTTELSATEIDGVLALLAAATAADGVAPLDEDGRLGLRTSEPARRHVVAELTEAEQRTIVGYAHREVPAVGSGEETGGEVVAHPDFRRTGIGRRLVGELLRLAPNAPLRIWAHGDRPGSTAFATHLGFAKVRELWRMRAPLDDVEPIDPPAGVTIRTFRPGADNAAWLAVNAAAFASHPEQGRWTEPDLRQRLAEPWFAAEGFFLAERGDELLGFHWTKIHRDDDPPVGEIYILGIHPDAHGMGLGKALASSGLRYLREQGLAEVTLFVESDNVAAIRLYERLGFTHTASDSMYRHPGGLSTH